MDGFPHPFKDFEDGYSVHRYGDQDRVDEGKSPAQLKEFGFP